MSKKWERWNKEELAILKKHYPNAPREDLMRLLPERTWRAIGHQAEIQEVHRPHYGTVRSAEYLAELHITLSAARMNRTSGHAPFAGKHHTADAKLRISVSNLYARGHDIIKISKRVGISEREVQEIIDNKKFYIEERSKKNV